MGAAYSRRYAGMAFSGSLSSSEGSLDPNCDRSECCFWGMIYFVKLQKGRHAYLVSYISKQKDDIAWQQRLGPLYNTSHNLMTVIWAFQSHVISCLKEYLWSSVELYNRYKRGYQLTVISGGLLSGTSLFEKHLADSTVLSEVLSHVPSPVLCFKKNEWYAVICSLFLQPMILQSYNPLMNFLYTCIIYIYSHAIHAAPFNIFWDFNHGLGSSLNLIAIFFTTYPETCHEALAFNVDLSNQPEGSRALRWYNNATLRHWGRQA